MSTIREGHVRKLVDAINEEMEAIKQCGKTRDGFSRLRKSMAVVIRAWDNSTREEAEEAFRRAGTNGGRS